MIVPAAHLPRRQPGGPERPGWGIPMATDIAFALGVVAVLGRPGAGAAQGLPLTLAIVDDIGAIVVIAVFYAGALSWGWLAARRRRGGGRGGPPGAGCATCPPSWPWASRCGCACTSRACTPRWPGWSWGCSRPRCPCCPTCAPATSSRVSRRRPTAAPGPCETCASWSATSVSPAERITHALHPWSAFVVCRSSPWPTPASR